MASDGKFWNSIAEKYAKSPVSDQASYEKKLAVTRDYMTPDMEVLEIGCGTGTTAIHHAPAVKHIRATDITPAMLDIARGKAAAAGIPTSILRCARSTTWRCPRAAWTW